MKEKEKRVNVNINIGYEEKKMFISLQFDVNHSEIFDCFIEEFQLFSSIF